MIVALPKLEEDFPIVRKIESHLIVVHGAVLRDYAQFHLDRARKRYYTLMGSLEAEDRKTHAFALSGLDSRMSEVELEMGEKQ